MAKAAAKTKTETPKEEFTPPPVPRSDRYCISGEYGYKPGVPGSEQVSVHDRQRKGAVVASFGSASAAAAHADALNIKEARETPKEERRKP